MITMTTEAVGQLLFPVTGETVASTYLARGWPDAKQVALIDSIRANGIVPLEVAGVYLRDGTHRWAAAVWLGIKVLPVNNTGGA